MKKTWLLLGLFVLTGLGAWMMISKGDDKTSLLAAERNFAYKDTADVYKIFIADRFGSQVTLDRKNGYWLYNNSSKARPSAIRNVLEVISAVEIKFKPAKAAVKEIINNLATEGIKVELYGQNGKMLKTYYVGGATNDERGTYMMLDGANEPYVVSLPSWEGNIRFRFNLRGDDWRDRTVFAYEVEDIQEVSVEYPKQKPYSFRLKKQDGKYEVTPFYDITSRINLPVNQGAVERYLIGFRSLIAEGFENKNPERDSIRQLVPFCIIKVKDNTGTEKTVALHPLYNDPSIDPKTRSIMADGEVERFYADVDGKDFLMVQNIVFDKVLWAYEYFFGK